MSDPYFLGKIRKNIINLSSVESAHSMVSVVLLNKRQYKFSLLYGSYISIPLSQTIVISNKTSGPLEFEIMRVEFILRGQ